jgi:hypothetical protein
MPLSAPRLDDRDFEQLFAEARARIPVHTPEWTNFNDSDPGITVVQLFAFLADNLLYRSNRIPEANRLKFLKLLGLPLRRAAAGRGMVVFRNERGPLEGLLLDTGVEVRAGKVPFRTRTQVDVLPITAAVFVKQPQPELDAATEAKFRFLYEPFLETDTDQLQFYKSVAVAAPAPGRPEPVIDLADTVNGTIDRCAWVALVAPVNADLAAVRAAIAHRSLTLGIQPASDSPGRTLEPATVEPEAITDPGLVFEIASPEIDPATGAGIGPGRYMRLPVDYAENVLDVPGVVHVTLPSFDRLATWDFDPEEEGTGEYPPLVEDKDLAKRIVTWIRVRYVPPVGGAPGPRRMRQDMRLAWIGVNAARVVQAVPVGREALGVATGAPEQQYKVANTPVLVGHGATLLVEVQTESGGWEAWRQTDDLRSARPDDKVFDLDPEAGLISFGTGLNGMRPSPGRAIRVTYEYGGGVQGLVPIGAVNKSPALPGWCKVENPTPTWGADAGESVAEGERNIPRHLRHRDRLVTAEDFEDITRRTPGVDVGRVEVLPLFDPARVGTASPGMVTVMVVPRSDPVQPEAPVPDRQFLAAVCEWLDPRRLVTTELHVRGPDYLRVYVSVGIVPAPGQLPELVERAVKASVTAYLSPLFGGPAGDGWPLDTEVRVQDLEAVATRVAGVRYVESVRLASVARDGTTATDIARIPLSGLQLPWATVFVTTGPAEDPAALLGLGPAGAPPTQVPVPVVDPTC